MNSTASKINSVAAKLLFGLLQWLWRKRNWTFGFILILVAVGGISSSVMGALLCALAGIGLFTPVRNAIAEKSGKEIVRNDLVAYAASFVLAVAGTTFITSGTEEKERETLLLGKSNNLVVINQLINDTKYADAKTELDQYLKYLPNDKDVLTTKDALIAAWAPAITLEIDAALKNEDFQAAEKSISLMRDISELQPSIQSSVSAAQERFARASQEYKIKKEKEQREAAALQAILNDCKQDYRRCTDNEMLINHYSGTSGAQVGCKFAAEKMANFGDPDWTFPYFSTFFVGRDAVETGTLRLVDDDVKFQNGFGAYQRTPLECHYDLDKKEVLFIRAK